MSSYGEALKYQREIAGITRAELAKQINTSQQNLSRWERGEVLPNIEFCVQLADFYGVSLDELVGRDEKVCNIQASNLAPLSEEELEILALFNHMSHAQKIRFAAYGEGMLSVDIPTSTRRN